MKEHRWDAGEYARHSEVQARWAAELLGKRALAGDERILDIGCGDGRTTAELAAHAPRGCAVGLDSSLDIIALAREHFPVEEYGFHGAEEYSRWLAAAGLEAVRERH